ncbi:MAG: head completion/stabilization protein [Duganella sp.]
MNFMANAPTSTPSTPTTDQIVTNDGFFPHISLDHVRETMRLDGTVTAARLRDAVVAAVVYVNRELLQWKLARQAMGVVNLENVPPLIDGVSVQLVHYRAAVYRHTKADLTERYRDVDTTKSGDDHADELETTIDNDRRAMRWAISDFLGASRSTIELI